jgi:predicted N-formylglutamate amidohydrolase
MIGKSQRVIMDRLLGADELHPAEFHNGTGASPYVLICEHASNRLPRALGTLGLGPGDLERHIAWDIGAAGTARILSKLLDAPLILQRYSRLAYDCNRPPESEGAMPETSEIYDVPGNRKLTGEKKLARITALYRPFMDAIAAFLDQRAALGQHTILASLHSFTPVYRGNERHLELGLLFDRDAWLANFILKAFPGDKARLNEPYGPKDGVMHLMNVHAAPRGLRHVMIEIRNDLIQDHAGQNNWANRLSVPMAQAATILGGENGHRNAHIR